MVRDVGLAEELAQDALVAALEQWPRRRRARQPRRLADAHRQAPRHRSAAPGSAAARKHEELGADLEALQAHVEPDFVDALAEASADDIGDDLLRLVFTACHPVLPTEARVALTLRLLGGLATDEIARAFLVPEATVAQRIVRAKRTLAAARVPFEVPDASERAPRLASVLEVVYLIFNEGYSATAGDDWMRPALCEEALRLGRVLAGLVPGESEVHGLVALMELQASRALPASTPQGRPVLLLEQDRARWDPLLIRRGLAALERCRALGGSRGPVRAAGGDRRLPCRGAQRRRDRLAAHRRAVRLLAEVAPSPVVELNRAVAVGMADGPAAGLAIVDALRDEPTLARYHLLPTVRGDLLARLGRAGEARAEFERAAALTRNQRERRLLLARAGGIA